jgi:hypothetical protein
LLREPGLVDARGYALWEVKMRTIFVAAVCSAVAAMVACPAPAKTLSECRAEWQAHKDIFQPKGISEHDYIDECRDFSAAAPETPGAAKPVPAAAAGPDRSRDRRARRLDLGRHERAATRQGADRTKKPEARAEFNGKLSQESNHSARDGNAQRGSAASPPPFASSESCVSRHSNTTIHSERCP